jgi:hypothetical protein
MATFVLIAVGFVYGLWFGLLPYMLLRYTNQDLFGNGRYVRRS